jgi:hypothetical protein
MKQPTELSPEHLVSIVEQVQAILYCESYEDEDGQTIDHWDRNKVWDPETLDAIAEVLIDSELAPEESEESRASSLDERRAEAAERAWLAHSFAVNVEDTRGWEVAANHWSRVVFLEDADGRPSRRQQLVVRFRPGSAEVDAVVLLE